MSLPPSTLRSYASYAVKTDANLSCARCRTDYCSRACQKTHWTSSGHKKACAGIALARRDTNLEAQSRALARVAHMSGGAPDDACCLFCLDEDATDPLMRGCACRGSFGWTHATCLIKMAEAAPLPPQTAPRFAAWVSCSACKQYFTDMVQLRLAIALWAKRARALETNAERLAAVAVCAVAIGRAGEHAEATRLQRGLLDAHVRTLGPEHCKTLVCASNLAASLVRLGEFAAGTVLLRTTLAMRTRTVGADDEGTLDVEGLLVNALHRLGEHAEVEVLCQCTLEKRRRVLGRDHCKTLTTSANLAVSLPAQGKHAEAMEIEREVLVSRTRLLGAEHESTLHAATNLSTSLSECGQKAEGEQLFRETLALCRRALGLAHKGTQYVLQCLRELGLASAA